MNSDIHIYILQNNEDASMESKTKFCDQTLFGKNEQRVERSSIRFGMAFLEWSIFGMHSKRMKRIQCVANPVKGKMAISQIPTRYPNEPTECIPIPPPPSQSRICSYINRAVVGCLSLLMFIILCNGSIWLWMALDLFFWNAIEYTKYRFGFFYFCFFSSKFFVVCRLQEKGICFEPNGSSVQMTRCECFMVGKITQFLPLNITLIRALF